MSILDWIILIPVVAASAIMMGGPARLTALCAAGVNLAFGLLAWFRFDPTLSGFQFAASRRVLSSPEISYAVGADGLTIVMILLSVIVTLAALWMSKSPANQRPLFYASSLLISAGALGAFCSTDVFFLYAFHELALIPTFLMIGIFGTGDHKTAAWKITIYLGLGSIVLLVGLLGLYFASGSSSFDITAIQEGSANIAPHTQNWIFLLLLIGFGTLVSLFPFHSWAAPAYAAAPTPTAMLHAGVLKNSVSTASSASPSPCFLRGRLTGPTSFSSFFFVTFSTSASSRSLLGDSTTCSLTPASCTWATSFLESSATMPLA